jgi:hypothetical protein
MSFKSYISTLFIMIAFKYDIFLHRMQFENVLRFFIFKTNNTIKVKPSIYMYMYVLGIHLSQDCILFNWIFIVLAHWNNSLLFFDGIFTLDVNELILYIFLCINKQLQHCNKKNKCNIPYYIKRVLKFFFRFTGNCIGCVMVGILLKQQSAGRHVTPLEHIILIPSQPVFALT